MKMNYIVILAIMAVACYFLFIRKPKAAVGADTNVDEQDANRFARLLVSEISLNETYKLERGKIENNIYGSLKEEIDVARKTYRTRRTKPEFEHFFDDQLVELLASGDKGQMGSEYFLTPAN